MYNMILLLNTTHQKGGIFVKAFNLFIKRYNIYILLTCTILLQTVCLTVSFAHNKKGYHSDELWSYGFACSSEGMNIHSERDKVTPKNMDKWVNSSVLHDYITIDKSEIFDYVSVYKNSADDYHPFLYFALLHFICSLFPGTFSMWYAYVINIIFFIIQQIFLFKLIKSLTDNSYWGIIGTFFFGLTTGAENIVFFLRMYCPATALSVVLFYYLTELYNKRNDSMITKALFIKLFITTLTGCLMLHEFIILAFIAALLYGLYYLFTKHIKYALIFGCTMISSALLSIGIFPSTISHLFGSTGTFGGHVKKYSFIFQFKIYLSYITNELFGVATSPWYSMTSTYVFYGIIIFLFLFIPFCFIFRHEKWLHKFFKNLKHGFLQFLKKFIHFNYAFIPLILSIIFIIVINSQMTSIMNMGRFANRYIMIIYPLLAVFAVSLLYYVAKWIFKNKKICYALCLILSVLFILLSYLFAPHCYMMAYPYTGMSIDDIDYNSNCIVMLSSHFLLTCLTNKLSNTEHFYATTYNTALSDDYSANFDLNSKPLYLLLDVTTFENGGLTLGGISTPNIKYNMESIYDKDEYLDFFKNLDITSKFELVGTDYNMYGRKVEIYRLN